MGLWTEGLLNHRGLARGQRSRGQDRVDQLFLGEMLGFRLQVFVGHAEIAVTQVVANRKLMSPMSASKVLTVSLAALPQ